MDAISSPSVQLTLVAYEKKGVTYWCPTPMSPSDADNLVSLLVRSGVSARAVTVVVAGDAFSPQECPNLGSVQVNVQPVALTK